MNLNVIYNEDCLETMKRLPKQSIDLIMTSPPYNMTKRKGGNADTGRYDVYKDWKTEEEYIQFTIDIFNNFDIILKENSLVLYNFSYSVENPTLPYNLISRIQKDTNCHWELVDTIIWKKENGLPFPANERRLSRIWEFVWVFARKKETNTFRCHKGVTKISEKTGQKYYNVFYNMIFARNNDGKTHGLNQATYSTDLCTQLFNIYAEKGYIVYDPFMGTGTTAKSCIENELNYIGSEISQAQCEYAEKRCASN